MNAQLTVYIGKKIADFLREFAAYSPEMQEFDMESDSRDIIIRNPACPDSDEDAVYIEFGEEFTVYWHSHSHFSPEDYWYDMLVEQVHDILDGRYTVAGLYDSAGKWLLFSGRNDLAVPEDPAEAVTLFAPSGEQAEFCRERGIPVTTREDYLKYLDGGCFYKLWKWNQPRPTRVYMDRDGVKVMD